MRGKRTYVRLTRISRLHAPQLGRKGKGVCVCVCVCVCVHARQAAQQGETSQKSSGGM